MVNWSSPAPRNPEKPQWLHERTELPPAPPRSNKGYLEWLAPILFGLAFTGALVALSFEARASWDSHRDWVVPVTVPLLAIGGVAMGYLFARREWAAIGIVVGLLLLVVTFTVLNLWRAAETEGSDGLRDALSIMQGVAIGLTVVAAAAALIYVEMTRPTRPPPPEM